MRRRDFIAALSGAALAYVASRPVPFKPVDLPSAAGAHEHLNAEPFETETDASAEASR